MMKRENISNGDYLHAFFGLLIACSTIIWHTRSFFHFWSLEKRKDTLKKNMSDADYFLLRLGYSIRESTLGLRPWVTAPNPGFGPFFGELKSPSGNSTTYKITS